MSWQPSEARRKETLLISVWTSGLSNVERAHFCYFKPPSWWEFGNAVLGNKYTYLLPWDDN